MISAFVRTWVEDLAHADGAVAVLLEVLRDRRVVAAHVPEVRNQVIHVRRVRPPTCQ